MIFFYKTLMVLIDQVVYFIMAFILYLEQVVAQDRLCLTV